MGAQAFWTSNNIYNSLLTTTPPPELKIVPDLAKSWEVLDEGRTYVFHLHEGVTFHDGTDFDAAGRQVEYRPHHRSGGQVVDPAVL